MLKKLSSIGTALIMGLCLFCGCGQKPPPQIEDKPFYTLEEAYNYGWLSKNDLKSIAYYHNGGREGNERVISENFKPKTKTPEVLAEITATEIKQDYIQEFNASGHDLQLALQNVGFIYYGCYGYCAVIKIGYDGMAVGDALGEEKVGEVTVYYKDTLRLSVWRQEN